MNNKFKKYPKIGQYRDVIKNVAYTTRYAGEDENGEVIFNDNPLPTITYQLTPKGHGTNAGIVWIFDEYKGEYDFHIQSRERIITPIDDNMGFATFIYKNNSKFLYKDLLYGINNLNDNKKYFNKLDNGIISTTFFPDIAIFGEWLGKGIQKNVGVSEIDKFFMIFGAKVNNVWVPNEVLKNIKLPENRIFNVLDYSSHIIDIDFNNPQNYTEQFNKWVKEIEDECPIAKMFGVENGIGEGWVAKPLDSKWHKGKFFFKMKGAKHVKKGEKTKIQIDLVKVENNKKLVNEIVSEGRLEQGISKLRENNIPIEIKSMGEFLKWLANDTIEEEIGAIIENGYEIKEVTKEISNKGRKWFINYLDKEVGL